MIEVSKIIRSKRKSLSISVTREGEIVVKAPMELPQKEIDRFLEEKQNWINNKIKKVAQVTDQFQDVISYRKLLVFGKQYQGFFSKHVSKITLVEDKILIPEKIMPEKLHKKVLNWYKVLADDYLISRLEYIAKTLNLSPTKTTCTGSRGRWGACNSKKQIFLNFRCVMLPQLLIDYVIVHELAHLLELNHSQKFWSIVCQIMPDYKARRQELKRYGFVLKLF